MQLTVKEYGGGLYEVTRRSGPEDEAPKGIVILGDCIHTALKRWEEMSEEERGAFQPGEQHAD